MQRRRKLVRKVAWYFIQAAPLGLSVASGVMASETFLMHALALVLLAGGFLLTAWWQRYLARDGNGDQILRRLGLDPWKDLSPQWYLYPEE